MRNKKGFTLLEMLIVVAIIAILISIAIPKLSNITEKAKETADLATLRAAYTEIVTMAIFNEPSTPQIEKLKTGYRTYVRCQSIKSGWQTKGVQKDKSGNVLIGADSYSPAPDSAKPVMRVIYNIESDTVSFTRMKTTDYGANAHFYN